MKVLFPWLWFLTWSTVLAYDLYGGYERVIFYTAYRLEWNKVNGDAKRMKIGSGCRKKDGNSERPCDILEFTQYINVDGKKPALKNMPAGFDPMNPKKTDADWLAKELRDAGATKAYDCEKIYKGVGRQNADAAMKGVTKFLSDAQTFPNANQDLLDTARAAVKPWADLRKWEGGKLLAEYIERKYSAELLKKYPDDSKMVSEDKKKPDDKTKRPKVDYKENNIGSTQNKVATIDMQATQARVQGLPGMEDYKIMKDYKEFSDPGHEAKKEISDTAKLNLNCEST